MMFAHTLLFLIFKNNALISLQQTQHGSSSRDMLWSGHIVVEE